MKRGRQIALGLVGLLAAIQLVTFERTNPPVTGDLHAPPEVKAVLRRACYDCHSNETVWRWYHRVAPGSWLVHRDVVDGRRHLNFSEWASIPAEKRAKKQKSCAGQVAEGEMPPWFYLPLHRDATLSAADQETLQKWAEGPVSD
jgi:hypothetical protein